jgi:hypothetical protein
MLWVRIIEALKALLHFVQCSSGCWLMITENMMMVRSQILKALFHFVQCLHGCWLMITKNMIMAGSQILKVLFHFVQDTCMMADDHKKMMMVGSQILKCTVIFGYAEICRGLTEWLPFFSLYDLVQVIMSMATQKSKCVVQFLCNGFVPYGRLEPATVKTQNVPQSFQQLDSEFYMNNLCGIFLEMWDQMNIYNVSS